MITTRMTGRLPNLDIEIIRRETDDGREAVGITFIATPTLGQAALNLLANPGRTGPCGPSGTRRHGPLSRRCGSV